jgi:hypothetical protein
MQLLLVRDNFLIRNLEKVRNVLKVGSRRLGRENWKFYHPDGDLMFINNEHKANWYLKRNIVRLIGDKEVQFIDKPKVKRRPGDDYLITPIERICVVCGVEEELQKHHVIPTLYRQFMPDEYKSNNHHDVVIICSKHHEHYERIYSNFFRDELAELFDVPTVNELINSKTVIYRTHKIIINKATSLMKYNSNMDIDKLLRLSNDILKSTAVLKHHKDAFLTETELKKVVRYHTKALKSLADDLDDYIGIKHAKKIVDKCIEQGILYEFIVNWRRNFIENMQPQYMPVGWDMFKKINYEEDDKSISPKTQTTIKIQE